MQTHEAKPFLSLTLAITLNLTFWPQGQRMPKDRRGLNLYRRWCWWLKPFCFPTCGFSCFLLNKYVMLGRQTHWRNYNKHVGFLTVGPKFTRPACRAGQQQLSIDMCCPRLTSAANLPAAAAAVDRRDRQTYGHSTLTAYWPTCVEQSAAWTANVELYCLHLCGETKDIFIFGCRRVWELLKPRYIDLHITLHYITVWTA